MTKKGTLLVVGLGIQWAGQTTLAAQRAIERADRVLYAVANPWAARWIQSLHPGARALRYPRDGRPRRQIYLDMVEDILTVLRQGLNVCAVFYGHPGVLATAPHEVIRRARCESFDARMLPGVSALDCLFADLGIDPGKDGCQMFEATDFLQKTRRVDVCSHSVFWQIGVIGNRGVFDASDTRRIRSGLEMLVEALCLQLPRTHEVVIYEASSHPTEPPRVERSAIAGLVGARVSDISTLYVPPLERALAGTRAAAPIHIGVAPKSARWTV